MAKIAEVVTLTGFYITVPDCQKFVENLEAFCKKECVNEDDWGFRFEVQTEIELND